MNKNLFLLFGLSAILFMPPASAQTDFKFIKTTYVGALDTGMNQDWTRNWTNWDPQTMGYPAPNDVTTLDAMAPALLVPGEKMISGALTLDPGKIYLLKGIIVVRNGGKLVIPAGTIIRAEADLSVTPKNYASIVVERGGQIEVLGTADLPVVITSTKAVGSRKPGDWGGLVLAGRSSHNMFVNDNVQVETFNNITFDPGLAKIGGTNNDDNSGIIRYLRLEFGGLEFEPGRQINALTLGAVGAVTEINHVQASFGGGDAIEWFGGTVNSSHLIAYKTRDDDFDMSNGYSGKSQFGIGVKDSAYHLQNTPLGDGLPFSAGFESDNEATGTQALTPYTNPIFSNYTMIGPVPVGSVYADMNDETMYFFRRGTHIRRNASMRVVNSIFMGYRNFLMVDGDSCIRNTNDPALLSLLTPNTAVDVQSKQIFFNNNLIVNTEAAFNGIADTVANGLVEVARFKGSFAKLNALDAWVRTPGPLANCIDPVPFTTGTVLVNPLAASISPDFRPVSGSPALNCANFYDNPLLLNVTVTTHEIEAARTVAIFPNPISDGILHFGRSVASFGIFDGEGNLLKYGFHTDHVHIEGMEAGLYFIKLEGTVQPLIVL